MTLCSNFDFAVNCKTCWGASEGCCNTCDEVKEAYEAAKWEFNPHGLFQCSDTYLYNIHSRVGPGEPAHDPAQLTMAVPAHGGRKHIVLL